MSVISEEQRTEHPPELIPEDHVLVLFGATGDLARRKLIPGLFHLSEAGLLPRRYRIVATSRDALTDDEFRTFARAAVDQFARMTPAEDPWAEFASRLTYVDAADRGALAAAVQEAEGAIGNGVRRLHYLSVPPAACGGIVAALGAAGLNEDARVILEKPFGSDLESAKALNEMVHSVFDESQIFRIDHFLGKETVQNVLALRFANGIFELHWNKNFIDLVQIDIPETLSIEGRAVFYEETGAYRDMIVTHLLQVLGFVAMEPPVALTSKALVDETARVFQSLRPIDPDHVVRGQYEGYLDEPGVDPASQTETFVALKCFVDNPRWDGVPFYLRTGKNMAEGRRMLTIRFKELADPLFAPEEGFPPRDLVFDLGDPGSIYTHFLVKAPGPIPRLAQAPFAFKYEDSFTVANQLEAYERLIHDALIGDHTLFTPAAGVERLWEVSAPVLENPPPLHRYEPGSWGPPAVDELIAPASWYLPHDHARDDDR
jgi:glucose-6-phosphate 1-dehydrogenase